MRQILTAGLFFLMLACTLPGQAEASRGETLRYGGGGQGTVLFDGVLHAGKGYVCNDCHTGLFNTRREARIDMQAHFTNTSCFSCHNNEIATSDCLYCHRNVPGSPMTSGAASDVAMTTPLPADTPKALKKEMLEGKFGATAQTVACLSCHTGQQADTPGSIPKKLKGATDPKVYHASVSCATCHHAAAGKGSFENAPHALKESGPVRCVTCHDVMLAEPVKRFSASVHGGGDGNNNVHIACESCHDPHSMKKTQTGNIAYNAAVNAANNACISCHGDEKTWKEAGGKTFAPLAIAHENMKWNAHKDSVRCIECHTPAGKLIGHSIMGKQTTLACSSCHTTDQSLVAGRAAAFAGGFEAAFAGSYIPGTRGPDTNCGNILLYAAIAFMGLCVLHGLARIMGKKTDNPKNMVREFVYPLCIRIPHWINALAFGALLWSGLSLRFTSMYGACAFDLAPRVHFIAGTVFVLNLAIFLCILLFTGEIRQYLPSMQGLAGRLAAQVGYYLGGIFTGAPKPFPTTRQARFNPLQQITYLLVLAGLLMMALSGLALLGYIPAGSLTKACLASVHFVLAFAFALFLILHVYLSTTGQSPLSLIRGMLTGYHEHADSEKEDCKPE